MSNGKSGDAILGLIAVVLACCILKMSAAMGLAPQTVLCVLPRLFLPVLFFLGAMWADRWFEPMRLGNTWPFVLAAVWWAIWPALDDWGGKLSLAGRFAFGPSVPWWASDGLQWAVLVVIFVGGAGWVWWKNRL